MWGFNSPLSHFKNFTMEIKIKELEKLKREVEVTLPGDVVTKGYNKVYNEIKDKVTIKGFRQGKIPQNIIEQKFAATVEEEVKKEIVPTNLTQVLREKKLRAVTTPKIDETKIIKGKPFKFVASFEVFPEFELLAFKQQFELKNFQVSLNEQEIDNHAKLICLQNYSYEYKDGKIEDKDQVQLKLTFIKIDGKEEKREVTIFYYVGSNELAKELDQALIGLQKNDKKQLTVKISTFTLSRDIAGKNITLEFQILDFAKPTITPKNKEFYQKINKTIVDQKSLLAFSKKTLQNLRKLENESLERNLVREQIIKKVDFEVPEELKESKIASINKEEKDKPEKTENLEKKVIDNLRYQFFIAKLIEDHKIKAEQQEIDNTIQKIASSNGLNPKQLIQSEYGKNMINMIRKQIEENKALDFIRKEALRK